MEKLMADTAAPMTSSDWTELERLSRKAAHHERVNHSNQNNYDYLIGVSAYASRMA